MWCSKKMICAGAAGGAAVFSLVWIMCMMKKKKCKKYLMENSIKGRPCFKKEEESSCEKDDCDEKD